MASSPPLYQRPDVTAALLERCESQSKISAPALQLPGGLTDPPSLWPMGVCVLTCPASVAFSCQLPQAASKAGLRFFATQHLLPPGPWILFCTPCKFSLHFCHTLQIVFSAAVVLSYLSK
ncbi:hypothetical protein GWK47_016139 [Chionoecetes opilio]|uniref:Uncharacterized protein n=1 Tax=Chionoecetes opilio TaxID=41210 RepID=A0A8J4XUN2_CHIOP|nr:hypothetical protein GWK47_016139 [Chionoecetes opilio]